MKKLILTIATIIMLVSLLSCEKERIKPIPSYYTGPKWKVTVVKVQNYVQSWKQRYTLLPGNGGTLVGPLVLLSTKHIPYRNDTVVKDSLINTSYGYSQLEKDLFNKYGRGYMTEYGMYYLTPEPKQYIWGDNMWETWLYTPIEIILTDTISYEDYINNNY